MAHGTPRINICYDCDQYSLIPRFSPNPDCPTCGVPTHHTTKEELRERYDLRTFSYTFSLNFDRWTKIEKD